MARALLVAGLPILGGCAVAPVAAPAETPAATVRITAEASVFDRDHLSVPANAPFAIEFDNRDAVPHNVGVRGGAEARVGEVFTGPAERTYVFAGLPPGSYTFVCDVHPDMRGTLDSVTGGTSTP